MDHSDQNFELNRMEATPTTENRPAMRPQRARKRAPKTPETRARPKRARETTRKLKTTSLQSISKNKVWEEGKKRSRYLYV
jgi:hypothetical protein